MSGRNVHAEQSRLVPLLQARTQIEANESDQFTASEAAEACQAGGGQPFGELRLAELRFIFVRCGEGLGMQPQSLQPDAAKRRRIILSELAHHVRHAPSMHRW